jgi:elongator complex protein 3
VRIIRLIRDIPGESIVAGNTVTNLRQIMQDRGAVCRCIRCREARDKQFKIKDLKLVIKEYSASGGKEYFISYESKDKKTLFGFCRLRLSNVITSDGEVISKKDCHASIAIGARNDVALIRELHVYGELVPVGNPSASLRTSKIQHIGLGKKLMLEAEKIARQQGCTTVSVIAGVGVRDYYRHLGYKLKNTYMIKKFS